MRFRMVRFSIVTFFVFEISAAYLQLVPVKFRSVRLALSERAIGGSDDTTTIHSHHVLNDDVRVWSTIDPMILNIDGILASLGVDVANGDVVRPVTDFHGSPLVACFQTDVFHRHIPDPQATAPAS